MLKSSISSALNDNRVRYLLVGGVNTVFGYFFGLLVYAALSHVWHIVAIGILTNIVAISFSYITYKLFVFKTKGNWLFEYLRCYVVYGGAALLSVAGLWLLVEGVGLPFWLSQLVMVVVTVVFSYIGHSRFTFSWRKG